MMKHKKEFISYLTPEEEHKLEELKKIWGVGIKKPDIPKTTSLPVKLQEPAQQKLL